MKCKYHRTTVMLAAAALAAVVAWQATAAQAAPPAGRLLASQCAQCHGTDGGEIAGEGDLYEELLEWKYPTEPEKMDHIMHWQIKAYTDAQLLLIAEYFSSLPSSGEGEDEDD